MLCSGVFFCKKPWGLGGPFESFHFETSHISKFAAEVMVGSNPIWEDDFGAVKLRANSRWQIELPNFLCIISYVWAKFLQTWLHGGVIFYPQQLTCGSKITQRVSEFSIHGRLMALRLQPTTDSRTSCSGPFVSFSRPRPCQSKLLKNSCSRVFQQQ